MMEITDAAILKAIERTENDSRDTIRLGVTGGGCAGWEYVIGYADNISSEDTLLDYGKFKIAIDQLSEPYLKGSTLDWVREGLNEYFKIINPNEVASCGCGVSVQFKDV